MDGNQATALLTGLIGFVLGGLLAQRFLDFTSVVLASVTIGTTIGAAYSAVVDRDITKFAAIGGGGGLVVGMLLGIVDTVWFQP